MTVDEIEGLRAAVGWDRAEGTFARVLQGSYAYYTIRQGERLVGFMNIISDRVSDALLLNLTVHPELQRQGFGRALVTRAVQELSAAGIRCIHVTYWPGLEPFYRKCGFRGLSAGIIETTEAGKT